MTMITKLLRPQEWAAFQAAGSFGGSADDLRDGYIHLSAADHVGSTAAKWFAGVDGLMAVRFDPAAFGDDLRWEPARGGILFPHVYRPLRIDEVVDAKPFAG